MKQSIHLILLRLHNAFNFWLFLEDVALGIGRPHYFFFTFDDESLVHWEVVWVDHCLFVRDLFLAMRLRDQSCHGLRWLWVLQKLEQAFVFPEWLFAFVVGVNIFRILKLLLGAQGPGHYPSTLNISLGSLLHRHELLVSYRWNTEYFIWASPCYNSWWLLLDFDIEILSCFIDSVFVKIRDRKLIVRILIDPMVPHSIEICLILMPVSLVSTTPPSLSYRFVIRLQGLVQLLGIFSCSWVQLKTDILAFRWKWIHLDWWKLAALIHAHPYQGLIIHGNS